MSAPAWDDLPDTARRAILDAVLDTCPRREPMHERDCPACDLADHIAGVLAAFWDPHEQWHQTPVLDGLPGDTLLVQAARIAAHTLHRSMPGFRRPSEAAVRADLRAAHAQRFGDGMEPLPGLNDTETTS